MRWNNKKAADRARRRFGLVRALAVILSFAAALLAGPATAGPGRDWAAPRDAYFAPFDLQWNDGRWWATASIGVTAKNNLSSIVIGNPDFGKTYLGGISVGRELGAISDALRLEWEADISLVTGREEYVDLRFGVGARWIRFPWNEHVFTTAALQLGPSYITQRSNYELKQGDAGRFKNGLILELTFALPERPDLALALRIHHRSSIFHLIPDAGTPSDFVNLGFKLRF